MDAAWINVILQIVADWQIGDQRNLESKTSFV